MALRRAVSHASITSAARQIINPETEKPVAVDAQSLYELVDHLGPVRAALRFKSMAATKVEYYVAVQDEPGVAPEKTDDPRIVEAYDRLRGLTGAFPEFVGEFAEHLDIAGEGYLIGFGEGEGTLTKDDWDVASPVEYNDARRQGYVRQDAAAVPPITNEDFVLRVWRNDPMRRQDPDSPLRSVASECQQYILLRGMITSVAKSRLVAGIMDYPDDWSFPPKQNGDPADSLMDTIMEAMEASVTDAESASRIVPITIQRPASSVNGINLTDMARDIPDWVPVLMERVLRQIATGLDLPADIILGLADVNHWNAWLSEDSAKLDYVDPLVLLILDSLTRGYLHPTLTEMDVTDPERYLFWRDYSDLIARSVGTGDAITLYDRGIISEDATRRVVGFTDADAPDADTPDDLPPDYAAKIESLGGLIRAGFEPTASASALGLPAIPHTGLAPVTVQRPEDIASIVEEPVVPAGPDNVTRGIPQSIPAAAGTGVTTYSYSVPSLTAAATRLGLAQIDHRLYAQIAEAAQAALDRALERAGQKIRSHAVGDTRRPPKHPTLAAQIDGVPNGQVGWTVGKSVKATLQLTDDDLIPPGSFDAVGARAERIMAAGQDETFNTVSELGEPTRDEDQERTFLERARDFLITGLTALALRRLFTPDLTPDPAETGEISDTAIPPDLVFDALTIAGGGVPGFGAEAPRGLANGAQTETWLREIGYQVQEREWTVGAPLQPFEPHRNLRGVRITEFTDPQLATPLTASWLGVSYMFPGDHRGCQCVLELVAEPVNA